MAKRRLTNRQKRFVEEYLIDLNGMQAAIRAGYSKKTASVIAAQNLIKLNVIEYLQVKQAKLQKRTEVTQDNVILELAKLAFSDMRSFVSWGSSGVKLNDSNNLKDADAACVAEVSETVTKEGGSIKFKLHDKRGALELLGKHLGILGDRLHLSGSLEIEHTFKDLADDDLDNEIRRFLKAVEQERERKTSTALNGKRAKKKN